MKISTSQLFDNSVNQMNRQQSKIAEMQAKLASGKQIVKPSDDSEKSAVIQRLQTAIDRQSVYERSLDTAENRLASEESALMSSERILQRIRQLAVQSNTDTLSVDDKEILANEITSLREELLSLANTQDANGNYVFAGSNVQAKAFDVNADGDIIYQGDKTQTSVDISDQRRLVLNRAGDEVFASVDRVVDGDTQNISFFKVIDDFAQALATDDEDALNLGLEEISSITEGMGASIADLGSRISTVNNQREILEDTNLRYQDLLSNAQDLDYATAVTKLSAELLSLEAAQASFAKISQLSLFNYIR
ncbi:MAG: flagellar hook-associated protein FlgL [Pseudomonadota bacterium]|nr:flagellar hook-associated protein FlgL [Pseudomonadota bacterium]